MDQPMDGGGDLMSTVKQVGEGLASLAQIPGLEESDQAMVAQMLGQFNDLVEKYAGGGGVEPADAGSVPMESGMGGKPVGPAVKN